MDFVIEGLEPGQFRAAFDRPASHQAVLVEADDVDFPCRVSLDHAPKGDRLLLINFEHQPAASPYQSRHAIYVAASSASKAIFRNSIPLIMRCRLLSVRAFDAEGMITNAKVVDGELAAPAIFEMLKDSEVEYLHIHFAARGCYAGLARRG